MGFFIKRIIFVSFFYKLQINKKLQLTFKTNIIVMKQISKLKQNIEKSSKIRLKKIQRKVCHQISYIIKSNQILQIGENHKYYNLLNQTLTILYNRLAQLSTKKQKAYKKNISRYHWILKKYFKIIPSINKNNNKTQKINNQRIKSTDIYIGLILDGKINLIDPNRIHCINQCYSGWPITAPKEIKLSGLKQFDFNDQKNNSLMSNYISAVMNSKRGCLLIGVKRIKGNKFLAQGIQLTYSKRCQIYHKINDLREKYIFPQKQNCQKFEVSFVKVLPNFLNQHKNSQPKQNHQTQQQLYIIRIYADTSDVAGTYFSTNNQKDQTKKQYKLYMFNSKKHLILIPFQKIYSIILEKNYHYHHNKTGKNFIQCSLIANQIYQRCQIQNYNIISKVSNHQIYKRKVEENTAISKQFNTKNNLFIPNKIYFHMQPLQTYKFFRTANAFNQKYFKHSDKNLQQTPKFYLNKKNIQKMLNHFYIEKQLQSIFVFCEVECSDISQSFKIELIINRETVIDISELNNTVSVKPSLQLKYSLVKNNPSHIFNDLQKNIPQHTQFNRFLIPSDLPKNTEKILEFPQFRHKPQKNSHHDDKQKQQYFL